MDVVEVAHIINTHFRTYAPIPDVGVHVGGYDVNGAMKVYNVAPRLDQVNLLNPPNDQGETQGASWGGESDVVARLLLPLFTRNPAGAYEALPFYQVPWQFFTLQDAIDFAVFAIQTTIDCVRFFPRPKTVGGPIDVLVIRSDKAVWVNKKELKVSIRD